MFRNMWYSAQFYANCNRICFFRKIPYLIRRTIVYIYYLIIIIIFFFFLFRQSNCKLYLIVMNNFQQSKQLFKITTPALNVPTKVTTTTHLSWQAQQQLRTLDIETLKQHFRVLLSPFRFSSGTKA